MNENIKRLEQQLAEERENAVKEGLARLERIITETGYFEDRRYFPRTYGEWHRINP